MMVKKFEARTIKEAIALVKSELGPDAIILAAKENSTGFGIMGGTSVEVTAAVSENRWRSKEITEKKFNKSSMEKFKNIPARRQKEVIEKVVRSQAAAQKVAMANEALEQARSVPAPRVRPLTSVRYADILDAGEENHIEYGASTPVVGTTPARHQEVSRRSTAPSLSRPTAPAAPTANVDGRELRAGVEDHKVLSLQKEVLYLKSLLENFQKVPKSFMSLHPGAEEGLPFELSFAFEKLLAAGVSTDNATEILKVANEVLPADQKKKKAFVDGWLIKYFLDNIDVQKNPMHGKVHVFLGATGQGKTSTVVKIACHLMMKEKKKVALLTGDTLKVGATDQFKIYAQILNVPSGVVQNASQWSLISEQLQNVDYILLDTPGVTLKNPADIDRIRSILPPNMQGVRTHYVQSALSRDTDAFELAERFKIFGFDDVIFTRLDEAVQHGLIYNFQKKFSTPLHSFGIGPAIPEDFEYATKERVADLIFNLSKFRK